MSRTVVLVGAGHTHALVLLGLIRRPLVDARLQIVVDSPIAPYSGMLPGLVAGQYQAAELAIDVRPLAEQAGAELIIDRALGVDPTQRQIRLATGSALTYSAASINIGSTVRGLDLPGVREHALATRPLQGLIPRLQRLLDARPAPADTPICVVGAGAGGLELAFCLQARCRRDWGEAPPITLLSTAPTPLADGPRRLSRRLQELAGQRGIDFRGCVRVTAMNDCEVRLERGEWLPSRHTLWVTGAAGVPFEWGSAAHLDERGFVRVSDTLRVHGASHCFAVGDCAVPAGCPDIPKAGVYAVRQAPVLEDNLRRLLADQPLRRYRPQRAHLTILNLGDGTAIASKWGLYWRSAAMMRWKDRLDRAFMRRLQPSGG